MMTGYNITIDVKDTSDNDFDIKHYFDEYMIAKECDWQFGSKTDSGYHCGKYMIEVIYTYYYENGGNRKIKSIIIRNVRYGYRIREEIDKLAYELKNELETMVDKDNVTINKRRTIYIGCSSFVNNYYPNNSRYLCSDK